VSRTSFEYSSSGVADHLPQAKQGARFAMCIISQNSTRIRRALQLYRYGKVLMILACWLELILTAEDTKESYEL
jgi:hypothetical protein